jgi:hypothetical protein
MIENPIIHKKYSGGYIVAIVKENGQYLPRGTFEYCHRTHVTLFPGSSLPGFKVAPVKIPRDEMGKYIEVIQLLTKLDKMDVVALYWGVGDESAELFLNALNDLNAGQEVNLETLLI